MASAVRATPTAELAHIGRPRGVATEAPPARRRCRRLLNFIGLNMKGLCGRSGRWLRLRPYRVVRSGIVNEQVEVVAIIAIILSGHVEGRDSRPNRKEGDRHPSETPARKGSGANLSRRVVSAARHFRTARTRKNEWLEDPRNGADKAVWSTGWQKHARFSQKQTSITMNHV